MILAEQEAINTIKMLSADSIQKANSGHPGIALGIAPTVFTLWSKCLNHSPKNPDWKNRDRFILSAGHGSSLLYSLLHIFGYGLSIDDLKQFRQIGSKTPGHPEFGHTKGVEITTGPLGQGIANAVGMAIAETHLASNFNKEDFKIVDHFTYAVCGEGCLMEGVALEAISLAGTLSLGKLIVIYDCNNITIEGDSSVVFDEDILKKFEACNWDVHIVEDGNNIKNIEDAINSAKKCLKKPSLIKVKTIIGDGSPNKSGKASAHGEPLGHEEIKIIKRNIGFDFSKSFFVSENVKNYMIDVTKRLEKKEDAWNNLIKEYKQKYPKDYENFELWHNFDFVEALKNDESFWNYDKDMPTRQSSEIILNKISNIMPNLFGGSADLAPSNKSIMHDKKHYSKKTPEGSNIHFGVREHAMAAITNGILAHGGLRTYTAGFFVFSDYMKPSIRLSSLMKLPNINIFTHDSIGVGEDGPTHQPIEQLAALRSIPNHIVFRPCDTNETAAAWFSALSQKNTPTSLVFTRQTTKCIGDSKKALKGGYILKKCEKDKPDLIIIATGSEVCLAYDAYDILLEMGIYANIVSMPSFEIFEQQDDLYKNKVLPKNVLKRLAIEAGCDFGWHKYIGLEGDIICINSFGESGKFNDLFEKYGFTVENVVKRAIFLFNKDL